jgi:hypothetical protein
MHRRAAVAVTLAAMLAASGCMGILGGPVSFSASPATVADATLEETGYEETNVSESEISREFSAAGQSKNVTVTNQIAMYERRVEVLGMSQRAAVVGVFATPQVEVLGQTFNPIEDYSDRRLVNLAQQQYSGLSVGESVGTRTINMLNESTEVTKFSGQADIGGSSVDVYVHVTRVRHDGDIVVGIAVYPQQLDDREQQRVDALLQNVQH